MKREGLCRDDVRDGILLVKDTGVEERKQKGWERRSRGISSCLGKSGGRWRGIMKRRVFC